ncbi:MAG TPA: flagellar basal-body MS-ring/collar protein FliF [Acidobacteriota bacterium]|nr:flagellar basal-body MS-ring/collar protein FliF [Acidobacteriota bacterium]
MTALWEQIRAMNANRRFLAIAIILALIVGAVSVTMVIRHVTYGVLYARLPAQEAGEVIDQLDQMKVPYRLSDGGSSILVPSDQVHDARIRLAASGLPRGGSVGFELFDETGLGMTDFLQKVNYRRALEGELARSISSLREVSAARVHIVIPEPRLFAEDQQAPTASVIMKVNPVGSLDRGKIAGITHLVASAVEGLDPGRVTLLDQNGTLLSAGRDDAGLGIISNRQLELQQNVESYLEGKAQSLLDGVLGPNKAIVRVSAELNFEQVERTIEQYDPDNLAIVSQEESSEKSTENTSDADGIGTGGETTIESALTNYEVNKTVQHIVSAVGNVVNLSVSVIVDGVPTGEETDAGTPIIEARPEEELTRITSLVKAAIGFRGDRSDQIEVVSIPFDTSHLEVEREELEKIEQRLFYYDIAYKVGYVLAFLVGAFLALRIVKKAFRTLKALLPPVDARRVTGRMPGTEASSGPLSDEPRQARLSDQMVDVARDQPDEIAKVIKTLMVE